MSEEGPPKLYTNKPKKSKLKASAPITASSSNGASAAPAPPPPPPPPPPPNRPAQPQKESFLRRYRFLWPLLLAVNFSIGAYVLIRTRQRDTDSSESEIPESTSSATSSSSSSAIVEVSDTPPIVKETIRRAPIPEDQQRELFKWMLEEKRKVKPKDPEEKKRIDEEKAVLKQFIRAKSIPSL
ncbi:uncharacterized protein LOC127262740 isoform X1 [Andrographis paniculata]|uniref:uncharacterized protein LOC127262740 isoform X1 n=1 Tax=Andrographis paniculata TaxID=175694 RepID=UPI0021E72B9A|nr:uncharacterized protein LOC127262740 isoform X1 [Andrographis paniculata]